MDRFFKAWNKAIQWTILLLLIISMFLILYNIIVWDVSGVKHNTFNSTMFLLAYKLTKTFNDKEYKEK